MPITVPEYIDPFLNEYVMEHKWFADEESYERALNDMTGPFDYLPFMYDRCFPDPNDQERLLFVFSYGQANLQYENDAPARAEAAIAALIEAHPEVATMPREVLLGGA